MDEYRESTKEKAKKPKIKLGTKSPHAEYFMPMLESFAASDNLNEVIKSRVAKSCDILDSGVPLFPNDFRKEHDVAWVEQTYGVLPEAELENSADAVAMAGRIVSLRSFGKVMFFHIQDQTGRIQCYAQRELLGETYQLIKKLDVGDIVGVSGSMFRTKTGNLTVSCKTVKLITRSMRPMSA